MVVRDGAAVNGYLGDPGTVAVFLAETFAAIVTGSRRTAAASGDRAGLTPG